MPPIPSNPATLRLADLVLLETGVCQQAVMSARSVRPLVVWRRPIGRLWQSGGLRSVRHDPAVKPKESIFCRARHCLPLRILQSNCADDSELSQDRTEEFWSVAAG